MKKSIWIMIIFILLGMTIPGKEVASEEEYQVIPDEAIRLRILANSDSEEDQRIKRMVRDEVNVYISELVQYMDDITEARKAIRDELPAIRNIVADTLKTIGKTDAFQVDYRSDVTFPTKIYDQYIYPAGEYEAVLISIGEGKGANWWCVLFPPLCFLDFSNGAVIDENEDTRKDERTEQVDIEEEENDPSVETEEMEISFFLFEWLGLS